MVWPMSLQLCYFQGIQDHKNKCKQGANLRLFKVAARLSETTCMTMNNIEQHIAKQQMTKRYNGTAEVPPGACFGQHLRAQVIPRLSDRLSGPSVSFWEAVRFT